MRSRRNRTVGKYRLSEVWKFPPGASGGGAASASGATEGLPRRPSPSPLPDRMDDTGRATRASRGVSSDDEDNEDDGPAASAVSSPPPSASQARARAASFAKPRDDETMTGINAEATAADEKSGSRSATTAGVAAKAEGRRGGFPMMR